MLFLWAGLVACSGIGDLNETAILHSADLEAERSPIPRLDLVKFDPSEYRIGPRDLLEIDIYELEAPTETKRVKVRVSQTGQILLPLIGSVQAVGSTATELQSAIEAKLQADFIHNPSVNVLIAEYKSRRVTVLGEVNHPGSFELRENSTTLINVLALAGSPTKDAGTRAFILRASGRTLDRAPAEVDPSTPPAPGGAGPQGLGQDGGYGARLGKELDERLIEVDLTELIANGEMSLNYALQDGDLVHVPKASMCFVTGLVHYPGGFPVKDNITLLKAIALAGGAHVNATPELTVLLRLTDKGRVSIPIDLAKVKSGTKSDLKMKAGDVLVLSESTTSKVGRGFLDFFRGLFTIGYAVR